ncbi:hypothetical protein [Nostoc sp. CHAB 5715]|uniref:hypothetical protein n=1 Tax=Nostoc sp. CHAB 5715 TaxID=2780400 RepID=UPI001E619331|nr:hypothetical protein [Nostoc sp. CHAB 5715]MCC5622000.1 hypothetical protein [Nostoc sp. CHAB 5715]
MIHFSPPFIIIGVCNLYFNAYENIKHTRPELAKIQVVGQINSFQRLSSDAYGGLRLRISVIRLEHQTSRREH